MNCTIRGLVQKMDFVKDTMQTFLQLELPGGKVISALIEDDVTELVVSARLIPLRAPQSSLVMLEDARTAPSFPVDTLPPITVQRPVPQATEPQVEEEEQESDEDGVLSV